MAKIPKTADEMRDDFNEAIELLEINCMTYDCVTFNAAKQISNSLHQLVDNRGQNVSHLKKLGIDSSLKIWKSPAILKIGQDFSNITMGVMFGIAHDKIGFMVPYARNLPTYVHEGSTKVRSVETTVDNWLDEAVIRLRSGETLSRRAVIRAVRDQDAGAHSDGSLDSLYVDFKKSESINPKSTIVINGKSVDVGPLLTNPALATLRQIAHEFISSIYSDSHFMPKRNPRCVVYQYNSTGELNTIRRPKGYNDFPIKMPLDILAEH